MEYGDGEGEVEESLRHSPERQRREKKKKSRRRERRRSSTTSDERHSKKDRKKKRHRRRSSDSRSRSRSRSKSGDRRRHRRRYRSRSRSWSRSDDSRGSDGWGGGSRHQARGQDSYKYQTPNSTIMVRGMAPNIAENDIRQDLLKNGILVKDIRLIRHRDTGTSRGFAFAEFHTVADAKKWMELKKGAVTFSDGSEGNLIYSLTKGGVSDSTYASADWYCAKCHAYNFKRRELCYKCNEAKPPEVESEMTCEVSNSPTTTIMLFELDALTTEDGVLQAFQSHDELASLPIRSVRIPREPATNLSERVCYLESNNVADSIRLFTALTEASLTIDGVEVQAVYHKPPAPTVKSNVAAAALAAAQWTNNGIPCPEDETDTEKMAEYSAKLYAKNDAEYTSYLSYYREYYRKKSETDLIAKNLAPSCSTEVSSSSSAIINRVDMTASGHHSVGRTEPSRSRAMHTPPDPSKFTYDEASGYYYDPASGYYYDSTNQQYYDSKTQQFLVWESQQQKYIVTGHNSDATSSQDSNSTSVDVKASKKAKSQTKAKKTIAKEMEKWAKSLNRKIDEYREPEVFTKWSKTDAVVLKPSPVILCPKGNADSEEDSCSNGLPDSQLTHDSDSNSSNPDLRFLDKTKIACLLCKRQFSTLDVLMKHAKMSDLHKQNLVDVLGMQSSQDSEVIVTTQTSTSGYRDRAKERRLKFGSEHDTSSNSLKDIYIKAKEEIVTNYVEEPTKVGIKEDNIGNRMLQKMGWQAGQGLGRDNRGIKDPITADRRFGKFGLGLDVPSVAEIDDSDDRQTKARKLTMARYLKLE